MWELLIGNFEKKNVHLTKAEIDVVKSYFSHRKYRKHQFILQQGDIATYDNFIVKGIARTYRIDEKGHEHILRFTPEDWWAGDLGSFLSSKPSSSNVDCLEDTEVLRISGKDLELLCDQVPAMNKYFRLLYQNSLVSYSERIASTLSKSARERYEEFIQRYPQIEQRVPNHQIASYLGIKPQSLSRIRSQVAAGKN